MTAARINPDMLIWARERSGIALAEFAKKCGVKETKLTAWEAGEEKPTFNQAMRYAEKAHVPFGYLFLSKPPVENLPIPDLRTVDGQGVNRPSAELLDLVKIMLHRQEWYREYLKLNAMEPLRTVGRFSTNSNINEVVADMRHKLGVAAHPQRGNWEDYYRDLVKRIEDLGVLVMRQGNLGHYTRPLRVDEFRGFAITDNYAPIIFVNHADAPGARLFTLIHELCHIWIGQSGISDGSTRNTRKEEVFCNAVAAEFLVPTTEFPQLWDKQALNWRENLPPLESHFRVSKWVLARRALTLNYITHEEYGRFIAEQQAEYKNKEDKGGGATYYGRMKAQISQLFSKAVVSEALNGHLLLREASDLLDGIKPSNIAIFAKELGV